MPKKEEICCPKFNPKTWDDKILTWKDKLFVKGKVLTLFYIPLTFGKAIVGIFKDMEKAKAKATGLCLSDHTKWNMDIYVETDKAVKGRTNVTMSGRFYSKVYEGPYKDTDKWYADFTKRMKAKKLKMGKLYMWYNYCPKCAKKYGKQYTTMIAKIDE